MIRISSTKQQKILTLYKAGENFKRISKQVKSDWRTVKKIVEAQKDLAEAQNNRNKRRSEVLDPLVSGRGIIAIRTTEATIREAAMELIEQLIKRLDGGYG